jgi:transposase-like protein
MKHSNGYYEDEGWSESETIRQEIKETKKKLQELEHELHQLEQAEYENKYGRINYADALKKVMKKS